MPCACLIPVPQYPDTADWGPILWTVLHGLAEKAGRAAMPPDEVREWQKLIKATALMLPCDKCRDHFGRFLKANPVEQLTTIPYKDIRIWVRSWFYTLHNEVNVEAGKPPFDFALLASTYASVAFQDLFWRLEPVIKRAIQLNGVSLMKWQAWVHSFRMMRSILAV